MNTVHEIEQEFNRVRQQMINQGFNPADVDKARATIGEQILWDQIRPLQMRICDKCGLHVEQNDEKANNSPAGVGPVFSPLAIIGEGPGPEEDRWNLPFVGASGHMLTISLDKANVRRDRVFITNITRCMPREGKKVNDERVKICLPLLEFELGCMYDLKVIITMGAHSMHALRGDYNLKISQERGQWVDYNGIPMIHTWHPSYVLRQLDTSPEAFKKAKAEFWTDLSKAVGRAMELAPRYPWS